MARRHLHLRKARSAARAGKAHWCLRRDSGACFILGEGGGAPRRRCAYDPGMRREACTKPDEAPASASGEDACTREGMRAELLADYVVGLRELSNSANDIGPPVNMT